MSHDFAASLTYSHDQADQPWWEQVYRRAFPDFVAMHGSKWIAAATTERDGFRWCVADNRRYDSISIAVPVATLRAAINDAMTVTWSVSNADWPPVAHQGDAA